MFLCRSLFYYNIFFLFTTGNAEFIEDGIVFLCDIQPVEFTSKNALCFPRTYLIHDNLFSKLSFQWIIEKDEIANGIRTIKIIMLLFNDGSSTFKITENPKNITYETWLFYLDNDNNDSKELCNNQSIILPSEIKKISQSQTIFEYVHLFSPRALRFGELFSLTFTLKEDDYKDKEIYIYTKNALGKSNCISVIKKSN